MVFPPLLADFTVVCTKLLERLRQTWLQSDPAGCQQLLHELYGMASSLGARELSQRCRTLEDQVRQGTLPPIEAFQALEDAYHGAHATLALYQQELLQRPGAVKPLPSLTTTATLLLVEDHLLTQQVVQRLLEERADWRLIPVSCAEEALDYLRRNPPPDLIILDLNLPSPGDTVLSGLRFIEQLQPPLPFIVLTVDSSRASLEAAFTAGALGYCVKPPHPDHLYAAVTVALTWSAERRQHSQQLLQQQAVGILMATHHLSSHEAQRTLRQLARQRRRNVQEIAQAVVDAQTVLNDLSGLESRPEDR